MAYATLDDLYALGVQVAAVDDATAATRQLAAASSVADSYLANHFTLPLVAPYPDALIEAVCRIAAYNYLSVRGYNPEGDAGALELRYRAAMKWLEDVGAGKASPVVQDANGPGNEGGPVVVQLSVGYDGTAQVGTPTPRGW